jgi:Fe-S-cluster containining protein
MAMSLKAKTISCSTCHKAVLMCERIPGLGTPKEIEILIDKGHAKSLMARLWHDDTYFITPATVSKAGLEDDGTWRSWGACTLLKDGRCSIYDDRPYECRVACCKKNVKDEREAIVALWAEPDGLRVLEKWRNKINETTS